MAARDVAVSPGSMPIDVSDVGKDCVQKRLFHVLHCVALPMIGALRSNRMLSSSFGTNPDEWHWYPPSMPRPIWRRSQPPPDTRT